jgi:hypothetical protein
MTTKFQHLMHIWRGRDKFLNQMNPTFIDPITKNTLYCMKILGNSQLQTTKYWGKEACNWGNGLSAAIKLGSLEKTVGASLIALCCVLSSLFLEKKTNYITFCLRSWHSIFLQKKTNYFLIMCQTKVLFYWLQVCLQLDCKNLGSGVPSLMAADKPCNLL